MATAEVSTSAWCVYLQSQCVCGFISKGNFFFLGLIKSLGEWFCEISFSEVS